jgi:caffeoyl-CoA O-methyltransferase
MIISGELEEYTELHSSQESELLHRLQRETHLNTAYPSMLSSPVMGRYLSMISRLVKPSHILEIGTFTGYSAICMAEGLAEGGKLHTIDIDPETRATAARYITEAGLDAKIVQHLGDALQIIPQLNEVFDLVFIDADKENYIAYFEKVIAKVRTGGVILADNALWYGRVLEDYSKADKETRGIKDFNDFIQKDERVENVLLSVRDGVMMMIKK